MGDNIVKKGEQNRKLSESVTNFKNQLIMEQLFEQRFTVSHVGTISSAEVIFKFTHDKSEDGEFFLEITSASSKSDITTARRICIIDIDEIEPT